ncbi:MAG: T9SS type A sorting domain-containing protein, partial [Candidatus Kapaibacterium sp.]
FKALDMCTRGGLRGTRGGSLGITRLTPNPANDKMNVTINSNSEKITINLYDLKGNLILSKNLDNVQSGADYSTDLNFKELSSGMYILIATDGELIDKKMVSIVK